MKNDQVSMTRYHLSLSRLLTNFSILLFLSFYVLLFFYIYFSFSRYKWSGHSRVHDLLLQLANERQKRKKMTSKTDDTHSYSLFFFSTLHSRLYVVIRVYVQTNEKKYISRLEDTHKMENCLKQHQSNFSFFFFHFIIFCVLIYLTFK